MLLEACRAHWGSIRGTVGPLAAVICGKCESMEGPIRAARAADGRKFSLNRSALVPTDTSRPCSHPPVAYMVHFGELMTRQVTPDVTWTSRLEGHKGGLGAAQATRERHRAGS